MDSPETMMKVAEAWNTAWLARDLEGMKAIAADDYIQWHSHIRKEFTKTEEFDMLVEALKVMNINFYDVTLTPLTEGVLQQCLGDVELSNGAKATGVPFAMVYRIRDGQLVRCDEYVDGMSLPKLDFIPPQ